MKEATAIILIVLFSLAVRIPLESHELGIDSFRTHTLSNIVSKNGYITWTLNPLSIFGLAPLSYPVSEIVWISSLNKILELSIEDLALLLSFIFGAIGAIYAYLLGKEARDQLFGVILSLIYSLSNYFIVFSTWTITTRGMFLALYPIVFYFLLKYYNTKKFKYFIMALLTSVLLFSIHRTGVFLPVIFVLFFVSWLYCAIVPRLKKWRLPLVILGILLYIGAFLLQYTPYSLHKISYAVFKKSALLSGNSVNVIIFNNLVNYTTGIGLAFLLAFIGFFYILLRRQSKFPDIFFASVFCVFTLALVEKTYIRLILIPVCAYLVAMVLLTSFRIIYNLFGNKVVIVATVALTCMILFSVFLVLRSYPSLEMPFQNEVYKTIQKNTVVDESIYHSITFLDRTCGNYTVAAIGLGLQDKISSYSNCGKMPYVMFEKENFTITYFEPVSRNFLEKVQGWIDAYGRQMYRINDWVLKGEYYENRHTWAFQYSIIGSQNNDKLRSFYNIRYFTYYKADKGRYQIKDGLKNTNKIYDNDNIQIFDLGTIQ